MCLDERRHNPPPEALACASSKSKLLEYFVKAKHLGEFRGRTLRCADGEVVALAAAVTEPKAGSAGWGLFCFASQQKELAIFASGRCDIILLYCNVLCPMILIHCIVIVYP